MPLPDRLPDTVGEPVIGGERLLEIDGDVLPVTLSVCVAVPVLLLVPDTVPVPLGEFDTVALLLDVPEPLLVTVGELEAVLVFDADMVPLPVAVRVSLVEPVAV